MYLGQWKLDDLLAFTVTTHNITTGAETDADTEPTYRVYEDETGTPILTGTMAKLDDANTTGFYSEQIALSVANGFEPGKSYNIKILATVGGVSGNTTRFFQISQLFAGMTSLPDWLRALARKSTPDATALSEINASGGAYSATTDSQEAIRDRGDVAWVTGGGGGGGGIQYIALPLSVRSLSPVRLKTTDTAPSRMVQLVQANGWPFPLSDSATVAYRLRGRSATEPDVEGEATVESRAGGIVLFAYTDPLPAAGNYYEEWVVTDGATVVTFPGDGYIAVTIGNTLAG